MAWTPQHLVRLEARPVGEKCPFENEVTVDLYEGGCVWLQGNSGVGKTTLAMSLADLVSESIRKALQIQLSITWNEKIPGKEHCGVLFQQATLLEDLTVAGNLSIALQNGADSLAEPKDIMSRTKAILEVVGLSYTRDAAKRPSELSGGMGRRASLALQLAQKKRVIVLDEPFAGLDFDVAVSVAKELRHIRTSEKTCLLLISHEPELAKIVIGEGSGATHNQVVALQRRKKLDIFESAGQPSLFGTTFTDRFLNKLLDYVFFSLPLIILAFTAAGLAISMLSADILQRLDVTDKVLDIVDQEVKPLIKMLTGEEPSAFTMMGVKFKVRSMIGQTMPQAKATLFAMGMAKLFILEIGPLLTALLLCGRIGGSYAGKQATMQATSQNRLLRTLGISQFTWSLLPSSLAALFAGPILTVIGTSIALLFGGYVGPHYGIGSPSQYWAEIRATAFPVLRLQSFARLWEESDTKYTIWHALASFNLTSLTGDSPRDALIEVLTYPLVHHVTKSTAFILVIMLVAELCSRWNANLTTRGVPFVITSAVVIAGLLVILADWGCSQLLLLRQ